MWGQVASVMAWPSQVTSLQNGLDFGHTVHVVVSTRGSRRGGDVAGAILDPQSTVGNKQIRPLASILVDVSPCASLKLL